MTINYILNNDQRTKRPFPYPNWVSSGCTYQNHAVIHFWYFPTNGLVSTSIVALRVLKLRFGWTPCCQIKTLKLNQNQISSLDKWTDNYGNEDWLNRHQG
jgi:hypothetical protein